MHQKPIRLPDRVVVQVRPVEQGGEGVDVSAPGLHHHDARGLLDEPCTVLEIDRPVMGLRAEDAVLHLEFRVYTHRERMDQSGVVVDFLKGTFSGPSSKEGSHFGWDGTWKRPSEGSIEVRRGASRGEYYQHWECTNADRHLPHAEGGFPHSPSSPAPLTWGLNLISKNRSFNFYPRLGAW